MRSTLTCSILALLIAPATATDVPDPIRAPGEALVVIAQAIGAQVYECEFDSAGNLVWQFREPIATLLIDGKTMGRHYAGPNWEMAMVVPSPARSWLARRAPVPTTSRC
jgi:hypothetical protein